MATILYNLTGRDFIRITFYALCDLQIAIVLCQNLKNIYISIYSSEPIFPKHVAN